jgi:hypothetical protein
MSTYVPVGLTHLLPAGSGNLQLSATDVVSSSGQIGPLLLKLTNSSSSNVAVVSYDNSFVPGPPPGPRSILVTAQGTFAAAGQTVSFYCGFNTATGVVSPTDITGIIASSNAWTGTSLYCKVSGADIGGTTPANDITYGIAYTTGYNPNTGYQSGSVTEIYYQNGTPPSGNSAAAILPTAGSPTKVFTIPPLSSDLVQIPASDNGSSTLVASGADVYVTPIQIV